MTSSGVFHRFRAFQLHVLFLSLFVYVYLSFVFTWYFMLNYIQNSVSGKEKNQNNREKWKNKNVCRMHDSMYDMYILFWLVQIVKQKAKKSK